MRTKRTDTKASVELVVTPGTSVGHANADAPFSIRVTLSDMAVPRMWVEEAPDGHRAMMLAFCPQFDAVSKNRPLSKYQPVNKRPTVSKKQSVSTNQPVSETRAVRQAYTNVLLIDASCSMGSGNALVDAKQVAQLVLHALPDDVPFNVIVFGSTFFELFSRPVLRGEASRVVKNSTRSRHGQTSNASYADCALTFVASVKADRGATQLSHVMAALVLRGTSQNVFLVTDGDVTDRDSALQALHTAPHLRTFVCGVGSKCNRHFVRTCARRGRGAAFFFDPKSKSQWHRQVCQLLQHSATVGVSDVRVEWHQFKDPEAITQAPALIPSLFAGHRTIVYG